MIFFFGNRMNGILCPYRHGVTAQHVSDGRRTFRQASAGTFLPIALVQKGVGSGESEPRPASGTTSPALRLRRLALEILDTSYAAGLNRCNTAVASVTIIPLPPCWVSLSLASCRFFSCRYSAAVNFGGVSSFHMK